MRSGSSVVFVLPFLAATCPAAARAVIRYRHRRLDAARAEAAALGLAGARFPWESAASGSDVTPLTGLDRGGQTIRIENGAMEEHIVADIGGPRDLPALDARHRHGPGRRRDPPRDRALVGVSGAHGRRGPRAHRRGDRPRRVPRRSRRRCVHERDGALESSRCETACRPAESARFESVAGRSWTAMTRRRVATSSSPASTASSPSSSRPRDAPDRCGRPAREGHRVQRARSEAGRRPHADHLVPEETEARRSSEPRLLRAAHGTRQLALARRPRCAQRPRGADRERPRRSPARGAHRPRRSHGHDRRRGSPRGDGQYLAGDCGGICGMRARMASCRSIPCFRRPGRRSTCGSRSPVARYACASSPVARESSRLAV